MMATRMVESSRDLIPTWLPQAIEDCSERITLPQDDPSEWLVNPKSSAVKYVHTRNTKWT